MPPTSLDERLTSALADRYEVQREIGQGGMARVYLARDLRHDRPMAIKVLLPDLQTGVNPQRFLTEIRTAANLHHPHILSLYDSGEADGLLYYTMPFVDGITLQERIREEERLDLDEALHVAHQVGDGLAHAHRQGLIHRDVKPSNVLLSNGHALLADFGLARAVDSSRIGGLTQTGTSIGTPLYMSPEQAFGEKEVDARSDIYSLGCVLYEMLTGAPPYKGSSPLALIAAHATGAVPSVRETRGDTPARVEASITRSMAKDPADRFASVEEFLDALEGGGGLTSFPRKRRSRNRSSRLMVLARGSAVALGLAAVAAVVFMLSFRGPIPTETQLVPTRVVVAPLENRTGDPTLDEIGRVAADWITEGLHRTGIVDVVPSLTALQAAGYIQTMTTRTDTVVDPIRALASETGAGKVISGAYHEEGETLLYQMQVTDAVSGRLLEALGPVRAARSSPTAAINELRGYVMGSLAVNLDERLVEHEVARLAPPTFESYRAFDEGMQRYLNSEWRPAAESFRNALALDTTFVLALHYLTLSEANIGARGGGPVMDSLTRALGARRGELAEYHRHWLDYLTARVRGRNAEALNAIRRAAELAPGSKAVYNYAYAAQLTHRPAEAVSALTSLDPERGPMRGWFPYWTLLTDNLHRLGEHDRELEAARRAKELYPDRGWSIIQEGHALAALGRIQEIERITEGLSNREWSDAVPGDVLNSLAEELRVHGHAEAANGYFEQALRWYDSLPEVEREAPNARMVRATALQGLGRFPEAWAVVSELLETSPGDLLLLGWRAILGAEIGDTPEAERMLALLREEERNDPYSRGFYLLQAARIAGVLGRADEAAELLRSSVARGFRPLRHPDMNFDSVRDHPALVEALTPVGE